MSQATATAERHAGSGPKKLHHRGMPFAGLLLMVPVALVAGVVTRMYLIGNLLYLVLGEAVIVVGASVLAGIAWAIGATRRKVVRWHVTTTIVLIGGAEAVTVAIGLPRVWAIVFIIGGVLVACSWGLYRIDALRQRSEDKPKEDPITKKLGLEETKFGKPKHHRDAKGRVTRIEVPIKHAPAQTVADIQAAVPGIESLANAPRGRSRAVAGDGAGESTLVIVTKDVLQGLIPYPGPSSPGGCITEPILSGMAEDQQVSVVYIAGGHELAPNPSSYGFMGMTRTGKTMNAQIRAMEMMSRRNVTIFWFDTIKGAQTVRPLRRGLDIIVASDHPQQFRRGMRALEGLIKWRADRLGECGYRSWTPACANDPRLMMPLLVAHFEECDALTDTAGEEMVFIASKGLSVGVLIGVSLQRADAVSMPTGLRFNIGTWSCFGTGDDYSAGFALSDATISAGAHPEVWRQSKPGYHYTEGIGIPEDRWPVTLKSFIASDQEMEAHAEVWGPRMMPLDRGSIAALGQWYVDAKAETVTWRDRWDMPITSANTTLTPAPTAPVAQSDDDGEESYEDTVQQVREEIDEMRRNGEIEEFDEDASRIDASKPIHVSQPEPGELSWGEREEAPTREDALKAFERALHEIADDPTLDDADSDGVVFQVGTLVERYKFRSRPWFSETLADTVAGKLEFPGLTLTHVDGRSGFYRLTCVTPTDGDHNP